MTQTIFTLWKNLHQESRKQVFIVYNVSGIFLGCSERRLSQGGFWQKPLEKVWELGEGNDL